MVFPRQRIEIWIVRGFPPPGPVDPAPHRRAANRFLLARLGSRLLLPVGVFAVLFGGFMVWSEEGPGLVVGGGALVVVAVGWTRWASRRFLAADDDAGIPIPDDRLSGVLQTWQESNFMADMRGEVYVEDIDRQLRRRWPVLLELDRRFFELTQEMRMHWLSGRLDAWTVLADQVAEVGVEMESVRRGVFRRE